MYFTSILKLNILEEKSGDDDSEEAVDEPEMPFKEQWEQISPATRAKLTARGVVQLFPVQAKTYEAAYAGKGTAVFNTLSNKSGHALNLNVS